MSMMDWVNALRVGASLSEPTVWKERSGAVVKVTAAIVLIVRMAKGMGYDVPLEQDDIDAVSGFIVTCVFLYFHYATTDKVGLLPPKPAAGAGRGGPEVRDGP